MKAAPKTPAGTGDAEAAAAEQAATEPAVPAAGSPGPSRVEQVESPDKVEHEKGAASPVDEAVEAPAEQARQKASKAKAKPKAAAPEPGPSPIAEEAAEAAPADVEAAAPTPEPEAPAADVTADDKTETKEEK